MIIYIAKLIVQLYFIVFDLLVLIALQIPHF